MGTYRRWTASENIATQSMPVTKVSSCSALYPEAYNPPTMAPMLVPPIWSMGKSIS